MGREGGREGGKRESVCERGGGRGRWRGGEREREREREQDKTLRAFMLLARIFVFFLRDVLIVRRKVTCKYQFQWQVMQFLRSVPDCIL